MELKQRLEYKQINKRLLTNQNNVKFIYVKFMFFTRRSQYLFMWDISLKILIIRTELTSMVNKSIFMYIFSFCIVHSGLEVRWLKNKTGKWKWVAARGMPYVLAAGRGYKKRKIQTKHKAVSSHDSLIWLTGLNRSFETCVENITV